MKQLTIFFRVVSFGFGCEGYPCDINISMFNSDKHVMYHSFVSRVCYILNSDDGLKSDACTQLDELVCDI